MGDNNLCINLIVCVVFSSIDVYFIGCIISVFFILSKYLFR